MHTIYKYRYTMQIKYAHTFKLLSVVQQMGNEISHFLSSCQDIWHIIYYRVTCQLNVIILSVHVCLTLPISLCRLNVNIVIQFMLDAIKNVHIFTWLSVVQYFVLIINYITSCQLNTHCIKYCYTMHDICKRNAHTFNWLSVVQ